jgi:hypothetical protein
MKQNLQWRGSGVGEVSFGVGGWRNWPGREGLVLGVGDLVSWQAEKDCWLVFGGFLCRRKLNGVGEVLLVVGGWVNWPC